MAKVTSKLQVSIPKAVADRFGITPGDEIDWVPAGDVIRVVPRSRPAAETDTPAFRLRLFDEATSRQERRESGRLVPRAGRRWTRDELYDRGRTR